MGKEIVGYDFGFVIGFMAEWRPAVDIAQGPDAICAGFEKLIGLDIAAALIRFSREVGTKECF